MAVAASQAGTVGAGWRRPGNLGVLCQGQCGLKWEGGVGAARGSAWVRWQPLGPADRTRATLLDVPAPTAGVPVFGASAAPSPALDSPPHPRGTGPT